jgi:hypothetical protein
MSAITHRKTKQSTLNMASSRQITEIVFFHLKDHVNLEDVRDSNPDVAVQAFFQLTKTIKSQPGFIRQFWVAGLHLFFLDQEANKCRVTKSNTLTSLSGRLVNYFNFFFNKLKNLF